MSKCPSQIQTAEGLGTTHGIDIPAKYSTRERSILVANNVLVSPLALSNRSRGSAYVHNLFAGQCTSGNTTRYTPYLEPHSTSIAGMHDNYNGDDRFYNNIFTTFEEIRDTILKPEFRPPGSGPINRIARYDDEAMPVTIEGNLYLNGAIPYEKDAHPMVIDQIAGNLTITLKEDGMFLNWKWDAEWGRGQKRKLITTELLGRARIPDMKYEHADGSPLTIGKDFYGHQRNLSNPAPGPFEGSKPGKNLIRVWPRE